MAQTGYTPISIYYSATTTNVPTAGNLVAGELAINTADGKLFYKDSAGVVQVIGTKGGVGSSTTGQVLYNSSGLVAGSSNLYFDGTNLGIGTSSPATKLQVKSNAIIGQFETTSSTGNNYLKFIRAGSTDMGFVGFGSGGTDDIYFYNYLNANMLFGTNSSERMRIDSSGNVVIGGLNSTGSQKLHISSNGTVGIRLDNQATNYWDVTNDSNLIFGRGGSEKMRIDSSGNLLVGTTSQVNASILNASQSANAGVLGVTNTNASFSATVIFGSTTRAANSGFDLLGLYAGTSVAQFRVNGAGTIYAQNTTVQSISDQRLKENIKDSTDGLDVIIGLRPVRYDWKEGFGNDQKNQLGFIAQEVESIFPEAVSEWQVNKENETIYKTVGPSAFIPVLIKAIQEQQALIENLTKRLNALEGK